MTPAAGDDPRAGGAGSRMECRICWYVYDPARGDDVWQVPPGTPWSALPGHWSCPNCAATPADFLPLADD